MYSRRTGLLAVCLAASMLAAQEPEPSPDGENKKDGSKTISIEVTGRRDAAEPGASSSFSGKQLERMQAGQGEDLGARIPNAHMPQAPEPHSPFFIVRGFGNGTALGDPTVALYVDDIPLGDLRSFSYRLWEVDHVTFHRGPQGTHAGRNAEMGLLEVRSVRPGNHWEGHAEARYGNYDTQHYYASASGPVLKDKVQLRVGALLEKRDGYLRNTLRDSRPDHRESLETRTQVFAQPADGLDIQLTAQARLDDAGSEGYVSFRQRDPFEVQHDIRGEHRIDQYLGGLRIKYEFPDFELLSVTSRQFHELDQTETEIDLGPQRFILLLDEYENTQWTQELQARSRPDGGPWGWRAGAYFEDRTTRMKNGIRFLDTAFIQAAPPAGLGLPFDAPVTQNRSANFYHRAWALFGEATYTFLDDFEWRFGLRLERSSHLIRRKHVFEAPSGNTSITVAPAYDVDRVDHAALPALALAWNGGGFVKQVYGRVARGWRPGGFSRASDDPDESAWEPEWLWNGEIGARFAWFEERLSLDATAFWIDARDFLVRRTVTPPSFSLVNADHVVSRGLEFEVHAAPVQGLDVSLALGYVDARFREFVDPITGADFSGNRVLLTPEYTFALGASYRHASGFMIWAEWQGRGDMFYLEDNIKEQGSYELLNAKIGYESERFDVFLFGQNLLNRTYHHFAVPALGSPTYLGTVGAPQTYGIGGRVRF